MVRAGSLAFEKIPVDASSKMPDDHMDSIEPFDYTQLRPFSTAYLPGYLADKYDVTIDDSRDRADTRCRETLAQALRDTVTDYGVHLGAYVETKNSNFARGNTVSHLTYIGDSDVGKYCNFGCGTVTCNYDGKDKFRTQIGDYCFIGCNTNLVAPVKVGDGAYTAAGSTITKDVPAQALSLIHISEPTRRS